MEVDPKFMRYLKSEGMLRAIQRGAADWGSVWARLLFSDKQKHLACCTVVLGT